MPADTKLLLIFSQTFVPDPASVGQHMADVAIAMAARGHGVRVYASARGYDDPAVRYARRENLQGADVRRLPFASFGKKSILTRILGTFTFMCQVLAIGLFTPNVEGIFFSTSPPLIGVIACLIGAARGIPVAYWAMDLNPDQLIALGKIRKTSAAAHFLEAVNRWILQQSALVIALDRFMARRLEERVNLDGRLLVMPPWPHENHLEAVLREENPLVAKHGLGGKFVVMYSGNHSPSNPLETFLQAAVSFKNDDRFRFLFVGGGIGKKAVEKFVAEQGISNAICLPYQPLADLRYSLTSADVHVVSLGEGMVGIIHPCKVYGAMAAGRPILYLGPVPSHIADLLEKHSIGWHVDHGDVAGAVKTLETIAKLDAITLTEMGKRAQEILRRELSQQMLTDRFCDRLEEALQRKGGDSNPRYGFDPV